MIFKQISILLAGCIVFGAMVRPLDANQRSACQVYGKVLSSGDPAYKAGMDLCEGQNITITPSKPLFAACWNLNYAIWIKGPQDLLKCRSSKLPQRRCTQSSDLGCVRLRGKEAGSPFLIAPLGETFLSSSPVFKWQTIINADRYVLNILGEKRWEFNVKSTTLVWPKDKVFLPGTTYQIIVQAFRGNELLGTSSSAFNTLSLKDQNDLRNHLSIALNIKSIDAQAKTVLALYNTYNLKEESKYYLEKLSKSTSNNLVQQLLKDFYLQAELRPQQPSGFKETLTQKIQYYK